MLTHTLRKEYWWLWASLACLGLSCSVLVHARRAAVDKAIVLLEGESLESVPLVDMNGNEEQIFHSPQGRPRIVYIFSPSCIWCKRNESNVQALVSCLGGSVEFVAVSLEQDGLSRYYNRLLPNYRVLIDQNRLAGVVGTPTTALVDEAGVIEHIWEGAYAGPVGDQIMRRFNCKFPGLRGW